MKKIFSYFLIYSVLTVNLTTSPSWATNSFNRTDNHSSTKNSASNHPKTTSKQEGFTELHRAAAEQNFIKVKQLCFSQPELIRLQTEKGYTVLHIAAEHNDYKTFHFLAENYPELLTARSNIHESAFDLSRHSDINNYRQYDPLLQNLKKFWTEFRSSLPNAHSNLFYDTDSTQKLFTLFKDNDESKIEHYIDTQLLIRLRAELQIRTNRIRNTAFHIAAAGGHLKILQKLIQAQPEDLYKLNIWGSSPLHIATVYNRIPIVQELVKYPKLLTIKDTDIKTALDLAKAHNKPEIAKILTDAINSNSNASPLNSSAENSSPNETTHKKSNHLSFENFLAMMGNPHLQDDASLADDSQIFENSDVIDLTDENDVVSFEGAKRDIPIANSFKKPENKKLTAPVPRSAKTSTHLGQTISFKNREEYNNFNLDKHETYQYSISDDQYDLNCYSLQNTIPQPNERISIILGGRGQSAYFPVEETGGRTIILLSSKNKDDFSFLLFPYQDVCVLKKLKIIQNSGQIQSLNEEELSLVTPMRMGALYLMKALHTQGISLFSMIDDNIKEIQLSEHLSFKQSNPPSWKEFFEKMNDIMLSEKFFLLGLLETHYQHLSLQPDLHWTVIDQGAEGIKGGFGQKVYFYNLNKIQEIPEIDFSLLLPLNIRISQEDLHIQVAAAELGLKVGHLRRESVQFERVKSKSIAKEKAKNSEYTSESWLCIAEDKNPIRQKINEIIQNIVRINIQHTHESNKKLAQTPLEEFQFTPKRKHDSNDSLAQDYLSQLIHSSENKKRKLSKKDDSKIELNNNKLISDYPIQFGAKDLTGVSYMNANERNELIKSNPKLRFSLPPKIESLSWKNFANELSIDENSNLPFWPHQKISFENLKNYIHSKNNQFRNIDNKNIFTPQQFHLATGTGKTKIFAHISEVASKHLQGNIAIISPNLNIMSQISKSLKESSLRKIINISSLEGDVNAKIASYNQSLQEGKHIVLFCEKSFLNFIEYKKGDLSSFSILIFDENHKVSSQTKTILKKIKELNQGLLLGFTATPLDEDSIFTSTLFSYDTHQAVGDGILSPWETKQLPIELRAKNNQELAQLLPKILNQTFHPMNGSLKDHMGVTFIKGTIQDLNSIASVAHQQGILLAPYHSDLKTEEKEKILQLFHEKKIHGLLAIKTLKEGFDAPVDYVFIPHAKGRTKNELIQIRGRALRKPKDGSHKTALLLSSDMDLQTDYGF